MRFLFIPLFIVGCLFSSAAYSADEPKPFQLSLLPAVQIHSQDDSIEGFRFNIAGVNQDVSGFDLGLFNIVEKNFSGLQIGAGNVVVGESAGFNLAFVNLSGDNKGLEVGAVNKCEKSTGVQFGFINIASEGVDGGLQIGLLNFNGSGKIKFLPFINF